VDFFSFVHSELLKVDAFFLRQISFFEQQYALLEAQLPALVW
jgi:hypothetical protein